MSRVFRRCRAGALLAAWALGAPLASGAEDGAEDQAAAERRLANIAKDLNALDAWLDSAGKRLAEVQRDVAAADRKIADANAAVRRLDGRLAATRAELERLAARRKGYDQRREEQARRIARHARDAWRHAGEDFFKLLLNQEDPGDFERIVRYHGYFSRARLRAIEGYRQTLDAIAENERATQERRAALSEQREALLERQAALSAGRGERKALLGRLSTDRDRRTDARRRLIADRRRVETLLTRLREQVEMAQTPAPTTQVVASKGHLRWPVAGRVAQRFGQPRAGGRLRWEGVYFAAPAGTEVQAVHSGRVVFADWLRGLGFLAIVDHGDGHLSLYGHADDLLKRVGDWVEPGEPIAVAGNSGGQPQSGLYFEVRANGTPTNPLAWLERDQAP